MESGQCNSRTIAAFNDIAATCSKFGGILEKINHIPPIESKGLSLLDIKCDTMISYLINLSHLILKKCNGLSIDDEDTRERLVNARVVLEKIKPLEDKLKYQIDKYVKASMTGKVAVSDKSSYRANLEDLNSDASEQEECTEENKETSEHRESKKTGIYRPPKLLAVPYTNLTKEEKQRQLLENAKKRALNSTVMQDLREEYSDAPIEITNTNTLRNTLTNYRKERERFEETYFTRLPITKKEKHRNKLMSTLTMGNVGAEVTRFEDLSALQGNLPGSGTKKRKKLGKLSKKKSFKRRKTL